VTLNAATKVQSCRAARSQPLNGRRPRSIEIEMAIWLTRHRRLLSRQRVLQSDPHDKRGARIRPGCLCVRQFLFAAGKHWSQKSSFLNKASVTPVTAAKN
jgi:hypothetical protein